MANVKISALPAAGAIAGTEEFPVVQGGATKKATVNGLGKVSKAGDTMTGALLIPAGTEAAPSIAISGDTGTGIWAAASGALSASVSGSRAMRLIAGGATFFGDNAGDVNTDATAVGIGRSALAANTTGASNTAVGLSALASNTTGANNTATGSFALTANTIGASNTAVGRSALAANTTGASNTAVGRNALLANTSGASNNAVGTFALAANTIGSNNTGTGLSALASNTTGANNTATGYQAGGAPAGLTANATTTALRQTLIGTESGQGSATQRDDVVAIGYRALVDGNNAIAIGSGTSAGAAGAIAIGRDSAGTSASTTTANQIRMGTALHTTAFPGLIRWLTAGNEQTTVGAAGGASALPATPTKYLKVVDSAGTTLVIPAYAAA